MDGWTIRKQITALGVLGLGIALILSVVALTSAWRLSGLFDTLSASTRNVANANLALEDAIESLAEGQRFMLRPTPEGAETARAEIAEVAELIADVQRAAAPLSETIAEVDVGAVLDAYRTGFDQMVATQSRIEDQAARMDDAGLLAQRKLTDLMKTSFAEQDAGGAYYAGLAQQGLLLSRFYMKEYMLTDRAADFAEAERWRSTARTELSRLDFIIFAEDRRALKDEIAGHMRDFWAASLEINGLILANLEHRAAFLENGTRLAALTDEAAALVLAAQERKTAMGLSATRRTIALLGAVVAVAMVALTLASRTVGARIVQGIQSAASDMRRLAGGDLSFEIARQSEQTELGDMARTLETFRQTALETRRLEADARDREARDARREQERRAAEAEAAAEARHAREAERKRLIAELSGSLGSVARAAARGDFSRRVDGRFGDPDLDGVAQAMNDMMGRVEAGITETARVLRHLADGDLTERMVGDFEGIFAGLETALSTTSATLADLVGEIHAQCEDIGASSDSMRAQAGDLAARAEKQAAALEETSAAMEEMATTTASSAEAAREATVMGRAATERVIEAGGVVARAIEAMDDIRDASNRIEEIVSVIDGIAFQTNLLALNASVEAARAGNAGKGFAVVATEVRALAQRSGEASKDIKALIERSAAQVSRGVDLVGQTGATLDDIVARVKQMGDMMEGLSAAAGEQAIGVREVTGAVAQMDAITQQNASLADSGRMAAGDLSDRMAALKALMQKFRIGEPSAHGAAIAAE